MWNIEEWAALCMIVVFAVLLQVCLMCFCCFPVRKFVYKVGNLSDANGAGQIANVLGFNAYDQAGANNAVLTPANISAVHKLLNFVGLGGRGDGSGGLLKGFGVSFYYAIIPAVSAFVVDTCIFFLLYQ